MTRKKAFLITQSVFCALVAGLLAVAALSLYLDGAAKQAEGFQKKYRFFGKATKMLKNRETIQSR